MLKEIGVGISGASGVIYARDFINMILDQQSQLKIHLTVSAIAKNIIESELEIGDLFIEENLSQFLDNDPEKINRVSLWDEEDFDSPLATGSSDIDAMVVVPCSMKTLSDIANGHAEKLIARAADVCIKEQRKVILVPRETPLNSIHLENMLKLSRIGVSIVPPAPGFYQNPQTIDDLINFISKKIIKLLG